MNEIDSGEQAKLGADPFLPRTNVLCTSVFSKFYKDCKDTLNVFMYLVRLAHYTDQGRVRAAQALIDTVEPGGEEHSKYQETINNPTVAADELASYASINVRHMVTATADTFLWYLSNIVQAAIKKQSEILRSNEMMRIDEILNFQTKAELTEYLIDRKVNDLSYGGLRRIEEYFKDRLGIEIFPDSELRDTMILFIEVRNIYVHNRGSVNRVFLDRVRNMCGMDAELGRRFWVDFDKYGLFQSNCVKAAMEIDKLVAAKFKLRRKRISTWQKKSSSPPNN